MDKFAATGSRKEATARVVIIPGGSGNFEVNGKSIDEYFSNMLLYIRAAKEPLELVGALDKFDVKVKVKGGGLTGQSEAIRHGLARALEKYNPEWRRDLKKRGFLTRDAREKERKKYGLRKARRAPQFTKR